MVTGFADQLLYAPTILMGRLLAAERERARVSLAELARGTSLTPAELAEVELGDLHLPAAEMAALIGRYVAMTEIQPPAGGAVVLDLEQGMVSMTTGRRQPRNVPAADANLMLYLDLLYRSEGLDGGSELPIRALDLSLLREALAVRRSEVERIVDRSTGGERSGVVSRHRRELSIAAFGLAVVAAGVVAVSALDGPGSSGGATPDPATEPVAQVGTDGTGPVGIAEPQLDIGTAVVVERLPDGSHRQIVLGPDDVDG